MRKIIIGLIMLPIMLQAQTLEECQRAAENNYPLIRQYGLIDKTTELTVDNIQKGWLPQMSALAQVTYQSDVTSWPDQMKTMMTGMGIDMKGLRKDQYKIGVDVNQIIYDGGALSSQKAIAREQGSVQKAQNDISMYQIRNRVNEMYFSLLMLNEQIKLNSDLQKLLEGNERKLTSMVNGGTAAKSDLQSVKAERLNAVQQATNLTSQKQMLQRILSAFCGMEVRDVRKPVVPYKGARKRSEHRPELTALDAQIGLLNAREKALDAAMKPKLGIFAQGYYGYPGLNMFEDMMSHNWSLNGIIGARLTWNIGALYTRKNDKAKLQLQRSLTESNREVFLFNNNLEQIQQNDNIERFRKLMAGDEEIISLRSAVRKSAESKLSHGIIEVTDLVREINAENAARVQQSVHEIEMLKEMYE